MTTPGAKLKAARLSQVMPETGQPWTQDYFLDTIAATGWRPAYANYLKTERGDPECEFEDLPGFGPSAIFGGVPSGETATYRVEFIATEVGSVAWSLCVSDERDFAGMYDCYDGRTSIR